MRKKLLTVLLLGGAFLGLMTGCDSKKDAEKNLEETIEKYGYVEKETVETLVAKFNTEVVDNSSDMNPASEDYLTTDKDRYWYGLIEGIYLVIDPLEFTNDKAKDIVNYMTIYVENDSKYEDYAITYAKHLIKANNDKMTSDEIDTLLNDAKEKSKKKENANNGKGISVGFIENTDNYQYQVKRLYK